MDAPGNKSKSLLQALKLDGGGYKALMRHAVAALLNAASSNVNYFYSEAEVIALVQDAFATGDYETVKNLLAAQNEPGCPLKQEMHDFSYGLLCV